MRAIIQRVSQALVTVNGEITGAIDRGLLILLGIEDADTEEDIKWLGGKIINLRIFDDANGVMNVNVRDAGGSLLVISQFTLFASTVKGNRPSYIRASKADVAAPLYEKMLSFLDESLGRRTERGVFGADMKVSLTNDGPVTIFMDSKTRE